ncbi:MAG: tryptophanase [Coriobacteriales bacterium]|jgi:tryptophanase|nr:tryptophanase [Coriobacteriales bacterium]
METVTFRSGAYVPLEMHKARIVQRVNLEPVERRRDAMAEAGFNTFLLKNREVFLDMLTDSGVNAMSIEQQAAMLRADDSYAGSETFFRLEQALQDFFGTRFFLPTHQGRAAENVLANTFVSPGSVALMNFHFTTTKALITLLGGSVLELVSEAGLEIESDLAFKGDFDLTRLDAEIARLGPEKISFVRVEAGTNLIGGQPVSMANMRAVAARCKEAGILSVLDASLLADNLYFIKTREAECAERALVDITRELGQLFDVIYFSARKLGCVRGGGIVTNDEELYRRMRGFVPLFEGFLTYGGMSVREMEALAVGIQETLDFDVISQTPIFVRALTEELTSLGVPVVTPAGGLGCHLNAFKFLEHIPQDEYPAGALAAAVFIAGGIRGMERGTLSEQRNPDGSEQLAEMELVRLAFPKRVFTLSHVKYIADRVSWLFENRALVGGLRFVEEPETLRFFFGRLVPVNDWPDRLVAAFRRDFGDSL